MTALQKVNLGTAPTGTDGDTVRTANVKANANVDVLNTQAALTSSSPNAVRDLTAADMGKRINFTPTAAATVHFPQASETGADQIAAVHNLSQTYDITMAIAAGSGDTAPTIVVVKPGEMLTWETDGVSVWRTIGRKKAFDEVVQGKLTVAGALTAPSFAIGAVASISAAGAYSGASAAYTGNVAVGGTLGVTGQATFTLRPTFAGKTPWDSGNFTPGSYLALTAGSGTPVTGDLYVGTSGAPKYVYLSGGATYLTSTGDLYGSTWGGLLSQSIGFRVQCTSGNYIKFAWGSGNVQLTVDSSVQGNSMFSTTTRIGSGVGLGTGAQLTAWIDANQYYWNLTGSDERIKDNLTPSITDAGAVLDEIKLYSFNFKAGYLVDPSQKWDVGFSAQQLRAVRPEFASEAGETEDGGLKIATPDPTAILPYCVKAIQELRAHVALLEQRLAAK